MEYLVLFVVAAVSLIGAAFSKLLADEFKAWAPTIVSSILAIAVKVLPLSQRDRAAEEWTSHVNELPGDLSRVVFAVGCIIAALKVGGWPFRMGRRTLDVVIAVSAILFLLPGLGVLFVITKMTWPGQPALVKEPRIGLGGRKFLAYKFRTSPVSTATERIGRMMRRLSFDELPQLLNVLKGQISLAAMPRDPFIREKFSRVRPVARQLAKEYFERFPKDRYQTEVESWRDLQSDNVEFTMKRLREPVEPERQITSQQVQS
jgi:hypothetical protein